MFHNNKKMEGIVFWHLVERSHKGKLFHLQLKVINELVNKQISLICLCVMDNNVAVFKPLCPKK